MRVVEHPASNDHHTVQTNQPEESSPVSEQTDFTLEQPSLEFKRGDTFFIELRLRDEKTT